jgi:hypothetical protein
MLFFMIFMNGFSVTASPDKNHSEITEKPGLQLTYHSSGQAEISVSFKSFSLSEGIINGEMVHILRLPGQSLLNREGFPDLPIFNRYLAIPNGSEISLTIEAADTELLQ